MSTQPSKAETIATACEIAHRTVWAMMTTVDSKGRPRSRIVHPIWVTDGEHVVGWLTTRPTPVKSAHLAGNPHVSLAYMASNHDLAYFDCRAEWVEDAAGKRECWDAFVNGPEPARYDPTTIWKDGPESEGFAVLRFTPYRIQAVRAADVAAGLKPLMAKM